MSTMWVQTPLQLFSLSSNGQKNPQPKNPTSESVFFFQQPWSSLTVTTHESQKRLG